MKSWFCSWLAILGVSGVASACTVPVFRYALDHWTSEPWLLETPIESFTAEPLATELRNLGATSPLNLSAKPVEGTDGNTKLIFPTQTSPEKIPAWQGKLDAAAWSNITTSPARQELAKRILEGESAIWVVVRDGSSSELSTRINKRLTFLESAAQLPFIDPNDPDSQLGPGPEVKLKFSSLQLDRADPKEAMLISMLAGVKGLPEGNFAALVFGRGRVLGAWKEEQLTDSFIDDTTLYLIKACSCQAKAQNPGWDLLMNLNWDEALKAVDATRPKQASAAAKPAGPELIQTVPAQTAGVSEGKTSGELLVIAGGTVGAILVLGFLVWRWKR